jgi:hypothetical protein
VPPGTGTLADSVLGSIIADMINASLRRGDLRY